MGGRKILERDLEKELKTRKLFTIILLYTVVPQLLWYRSRLTIEN
jgi:hypothetical protein